MLVKKSNKKLKKRVSFFVNNKEKPGWKLCLEPSRLKNGQPNMKKIYKLIRVLEPSLIDNPDLEDSIKKCYIRHLNYIGKDNPAKYMMNKSRSTKKRYDISSGITKDCWLYLMKHDEYEVIEWDIIEKKNKVEFFVHGYWLK